MSIISSYKGSIASVASIYTATVDGLAGLIAHWPCSSATQLSNRKADQQHQRHGTFSGAVDLVAGLPQNSDEAVDFAGAVSASVPHDSELALPAFSLSFWFRLNSLEPDHIHPLISKDESGVIDGDFAVYVTDLGELRIYFQDATTTHTITAQVFAGVTYHLCVRADGTGFDAYLNGALLPKNTNYTAAWTPNSQTLRFATVPATTDFADAVMDEVALYSRVLTETEVLTLAQRTEVPTAANDTFVVPESATTVLDVLANDTFVGQRSNLTVEIVAQATLGTATVRGDNDIDFAAGAVNADEADSFTYRITNLNGTSKTAIVNLIIDDMGGAAANLFVATTGSDSNPGTAAQPFRTIQKALDVATAGDVIQVAPGTYSAATWSTSGALGSPITLKAEFPASTTTAGNRSLIAGSTATGENLTIDGKSHVVVDGFYLNGGASRGIRFWNATGAVIKNCRIEQPDPSRDYGNGITIHEASNVTINNNVILDLGPIQDNPVMDYGIIISRDCSNVDVLNNYFFMRGHQNVSVKEHCDNCRIAYNTFVGAHFVAVYIGQQDDGTLGLTHDQTSVDCIVENNRFFDGSDGGRYFRMQIAIVWKNSKNGIVRLNLIENAAVGIEQELTAEFGYYDIGGGKTSFGENPLDTQCYANVIMNTDLAFRFDGSGYSGDDIFLYHNTVYNCGKLMEVSGYDTGRTDAWIETYAPPTIAATNNNVSGTPAPSGDLTTTTWTTNNFHNSGGAQGGSDLAVNPQFVGTPSTHTPGPPSPVFTPDFAKVELLKVQTGSALINAGTDVGLVAKPPPDIGHNEFIYL